MLCIHAPTCGNGPALEYNGDLYSCDHYVEPDYLHGNIHQTHMLDLVASPRQRQFGQDKRDTLTGQCRSCHALPLCNGGCPKDRFIDSRDGEAGHNYLCDVLYHFYTHARPTMTAMLDLLRHGRAPAEILTQVADPDTKRGRNDPCPCNSGAKFKRCHGAPRRKTQPA